MRDFTLKAYQQYIRAIQNRIGLFVRFDRYFTLRDKPASFCLLRHDVDRKPRQALDMAKLEHHMGVQATYYFRMKRCSFNENIIKQIASLGHEIGYHYEDLSDTNGNMEQAIRRFEQHLSRLRDIAAVKTCAMHGNPLKPYDNLDMWRVPENHEYLTSQLGMLGEPYLDIDYSDIAYINDTGRNWTSTRANRRDKVDSGVNADFSSGKALLDYLSADPAPKICFQVHPERWSDHPFVWATQWVKDRGINAAKAGIKFVMKNK